MIRHTIKILIVEDEALIALEMCRRLQELGYDLCKPVASGVKAVEIVKTERPDVILMDVGLPGRMDGIEAAEQIRSLCRIPIIFMSGYSDRELSKRMKNVNPVAVFNKPVKTHDILSALESLYAREV